MNITVITGSRADYGLLEWPLKCLRADPFFDVAEVNIWGHSAASALQAVGDHLDANTPDIVMLLGDRYEILSSAIACHLRRIPIAHIGGGDKSAGSYDDAMRDCISRLASIHFCTSYESSTVLFNRGYDNVYIVGSPGVDYIKHASWRKPNIATAPYVVVAYYPETIDDTVDLEAVRKAIGERNAVWITPNPDRGSERIPQGVTLPHDDFLNLIAYCDEFIGNSSAILYEAPFLGVKTRLIGKRQRGRVEPLGDGKATERIISILKEWHGQAAH